MSRRKKVKQTMTQENQIGQEDHQAQTSAQEPETQQQPEVQQEVVDEVTLEQDIVKDPTPFIPADAIVSLETIQTPAAQQVKLGTVVQSAAAPLGKSVAPAAAKKILSQPSKSVAPVLSAWDQRLNDLLTKGTVFQQSMVGVLKRYNEEMHPNKPVDIATARTQQRALYNIIVKVIDTDENFQDNWRTVVGFFREYKKSTYGDKYVNRFMDLLNNFRGEERQVFQNLLALLSITAGLNNHKQVTKYYMLDKGLVNPLKPASIQRVINYYA